MSEVPSDPYGIPTSPTHLELRLIERFVPSSEGGDHVNESRRGTLGLTAACRTGIRTLAIVPESTDAWRRGKSIALQLISDLPSLHTVSFVANEQPEIVHAVHELRAICAARKVPVVVAFVLGRDADGFAVLAGRPTSLQGIWSQSRRLRAEHVPVRWWIPLHGELVFRLDSIVSLAASQQIEPLFSLDTPQDETKPVASLELERDAQMFVWDFVTYRLLEEDRIRWSAAVHDHWRQIQGALVSAVEDADGSSAVPLVSYAHVASDGDHFHVRTIRRPRGSTPGAIRWTAAAERRGRRISLAHLADVASVFRDGARAVGQSIRTRFNQIGRLPIDVASRSMPTVLAIGAYGGDHIGDAAILGGVLLRAHRRYGTTKAVLMSQRPNHSRRLVAMLDLPVQIDVAPYTHRAIRASLPQVDGVVFAGGPLTDLPKQLVRHLYTVSLAKRWNKPFVIEGIGAGPFKRRMSAWTARRFVQQANAIVVRTETDAQRPLVRDLKPAVAQDPAFDYLATLGDQLRYVPRRDRLAIEDLLAETDGRLRVGLNIRPVRFPFAKIPRGEDPVRFGEAIEAQFEQRLAEGLRSFAATAEQPPAFIFFPMNAVQFGMSDLHSAFRIQRQLGPEVDFRVWQADPSLAGVVALIRRFDFVVSMRFHATIFALSQGCPVIGIDYRGGGTGKVAALLKDVGMSQFCGSIDQMSSAWLAERLTDLVRNRGLPSAR